MAAAGEPADGSDDSDDDAAPEEVSASTARAESRQQHLKEQEAIRRTVEARKDAHRRKEEEIRRGKEERAEREAGAAARKKLRHAELPADVLAAALKESAERGETARAQKREDKRAARLEKGKRVRLSGEAPRKLHKAGFTLQAPTRPRYRNHNPRMNPGRLPCHVRIPVLHCTPSPVLLTCTPCTTTFYVLLFKRLVD